MKDDLGVIDLPTVVEVTERAWVVRGPGVSHDELALNISEDRGFLTFRGPRGRAMAIYSPGSWYFVREKE